MKRKGISLIVLVITIVVIIVLAAAVILAISNNNPIANAKKARDMSDEATREEELKIKQLSSILLPAWNGNTATEFAAGTGTENDPYIIENGGQLKYFADSVNDGNTYQGKYIKLTKSINLGNLEFPIIGKGIVGNTSISDWQYSSCNFNGTFDGDSNVITGLSINQPQMHGVGLFGALDTDGVIKNLNVYQGSIIGRENVGGIVGMSRGTIINSTNAATVTAKDHTDANGSGEAAGGIAGRVLDGEITGCINYGNVTTKDECVKTGRGKYTGGIVGHLINTENDFILSNCKNYGLITCEYQLVGGIIGSNYSSSKNLKIQKCTNNGDVKNVNNGLSNGDVGGIMGWNSTVSTEIKDCVNNGNITAGRQQVGGILGDNSEGYVEIKDCTNNGNIKAEEYVAGGICGAQRGNATISNCANTGIIEGIQQVGGIIGRINAGNVQNCYNSGEIYSTSTLSSGLSGGIVAYMVNGILSNVYNKGKIITNDIIPNKLDRAGGIVGLQTGGTIEKAYNKGEVLGTVLDTNDEDEILGGIVAVKTGGTISKCYHYGTLLNLIGSTSTSSITGTVTENQTGVVEKVTDNIATYEEFLEWIKNK